MMNAILRIAVVVLISAGGVWGAEGGTSSGAATAPFAPASAAGKVTGGGKIVAGGTVSVSFPEMPPTLFSVLNNKDVKAQMTVFLPSNYDPTKKHPLLIFLNGGDGGVGGSPGVARSICEGKDFICVNMPLFKEKVDPPTPGTGVGRILVRDADGKFAWPLYKVMLAKLEEMVPNLDPQRRFIGGFSNGAHMTAALVNQTEGEVAARFAGFLLVDGGGGIKRFDLLKDKELMMVCGRWRPSEEPAKAAGVKVIVYHMKKAEHAFPATEYPVVKEWLYTGKIDPALLARRAEEKAGVKVGERAPAFKLMGADGKQYSLEDFAGKSAVALCWYLRAGSSGSRTELSAIGAEMEKLSAYKLQVLGVTLSKLEENKAFAAEMKLGFPLVSDPDCAAAKAYGTVRAMDGPKGPVAERWVILIDEKGIVRSVEKSEDVEAKGKMLVKAVEEAGIGKR